MSAPVASGWSGRRVGLAPTGKAPPCHGARGKADTTKGRRRGHPAGTTPATPGKNKAQGGQQALSVLLSDASLKAVQAHRKGATSNDVLNYPSRRFGMTVRPNHLGIALQRHRRAGRLENRDQRWYLPSSVQGRTEGSLRDSL